MNCRRWDRFVINFDALEAQKQGEMYHLVTVEGVGKKDG